MCVIFLDVLELETNVLWHILLHSIGISVTFRGLFYGLYYMGLYEALPHHRISVEYWWCKKSQKIA